MERTKGELDYINEKAREYLASWADEQLLGRPRSFEGRELYVDYATDMGWLSKKTGEVTSKGFGVAASFLRR